jgi:hypothetical protein
LCPLKGDVKELPQMFVTSIFHDAVSNVQIMCCQIRSHRTIAINIGEIRREEIASYFRIYYRLTEENCERRNSQDSQNPVYIRVGYLPKANEDSLLLCQPAHWLGRAVETRKNDLTGSGPGFKSDTS